MTTPYTEWTLLEGAQLLDPELPGPVSERLLLAGTCIEGRLGARDTIPDGVRRVDLAGLSVAPGFVDLHHHGSLVFCDAATTAASLIASSASLSRHGTTAFLATTVAAARAELTQTVTRLAEVIATPIGCQGALPIGIHLEGPWIRPEAAGAQPPSGIRGFDSGEAAELLARGEGSVRMATFAPEVEGARALQREMARSGVCMALGHSHAGPALAAEAVERGATHVTHLFNAMGPIHHREPGLAGFALTEDRLTCDLICDGIHVDPRMVALAARSKGERLVLITDRIELPDDASGDASFGSGVVVDDGEAIRLEDGRLAGSRLTLDRALANAIRFTGMTQLEAVAACTLRPARVLGLEAERGTLRAGARADLAILDAAGRVVETWVGGRPVFSAR